MFFVTGVRETLQEVLRGVRPNDFVDGRQDELGEVHGVSRSRRRSRFPRLRAGTERLPEVGWGVG
jgi:hypothetical protein